jgi:hypothetical protein
LSKLTNEERQTIEEKLTDRQRQIIALLEQGKGTKSRRPSPVNQKRNSPATPCAYPKSLRGAKYSRFDAYA